MRGCIEGIAPCNNLPGYSVDLQVVLQFPDVVAECCLMGSFMPEAECVSIMSLLEGLLSQAGVMLNIEDCVMGNTHWVLLYLKPNIINLPNT